MILRGDFFTIKETIKTKSGFISSIQLNPDHIIYSAHLPGQPVTPAVIQMQIAHELIENYLNKKIKMKNVIDSKFLKILNPKHTDRLIIQAVLNLQDNLISSKTFCRNDENMYFKLHIIYEYD